MRRHRPPPRHRGDPRPHSGVGEQLAICVLAVQVALGWMPSTDSDPVAFSDSTPRAPAAYGPPAIPAAAQFEAPAVVDEDITASVTRLEKTEQARRRVQVVEATSTNGIPDAALAAYQRAAAVLNSADKSCRIEWQLIAAIGRIESDHGRYGGNILTRDGVSQPGIYGIALDGSSNTAVIRDTDAGAYDRDRSYDRAVGPMQFIPSTWAVVGVDADGDSKRNPQDIDDAALAAAVYLCSGTTDLSTDSGRRQAVFRYNHSSSYVDLVLALRVAYLAGDFTAVPTPVRTRQIVDTDEPAQVKEQQPAAGKPPIPDDETIYAIAAHVLDELDTAWPPPHPGQPDPPATGPGGDPEPGPETPPECATEVDSSEAEADSEAVATSSELPESGDQPIPEDDADEDGSFLPTDPADGLACTVPEEETTTQEGGQDALPEGAGPLPN